MSLRKYGDLNLLAEKILVRRVTACVDALTIQAQRAAARGDGGLCASLALIFADFLTSSCPPVRHAAGVGLQCIAGIEEVRAEAERLLPAMLVATNDSSAVPDHNARCAFFYCFVSASSRSRLTVAWFLCSVRRRRMRWRRCSTRARAFWRRGAGTPLERWCTRA